MPNNPGLVMNAGAAAGQIQDMGGDRQRDLLDSNNGNVIRRLLFSNSSNNKLVESWAGCMSARLTNLSS